MTSLAPAGLCAAALLATVVGSATAASPDVRASARLADLCSASNPVGQGLRGDYQVAGRRGDVKLTRIDPTVDFTRELDLGAPAADGGTVTARWTGWVKAPLSGVYRFHFAVPGARLAVANRSAAGGEVAVELHAGRYYPVEIHAPKWPVASVERMQFEWTAPHGARYVVPRALLHPPSETVTR